MERKSKACLHCAHYKSYYTKSTSRFYKENRGYCSQGKGQTGCWECCALWQAKPKVTEMQKKSIIRKLNELCDELAQIKQIISELNENDGF